MRINLEEGTIAFKVKKRRINWSDNKKYKLFDYSNEIGNLSITKTEKNFLVFSHQFGKIKTNAKVDTKNFKNKDYHVAATWSIKDKEIVLYIDGKKVASAKIKF